MIDDNLLINKSSLFYTTSLVKDFKAQNRPTTPK